MPIRYQSYYRAAHCAALFRGARALALRVSQADVRQALKPVLGGTCLKGAAILMLAVTAGQAQAQSCRNDQVLIETQSGESHAFSVEVADTPQERARGLMFRETMEEGAGMLFVYPAEQPVSFWMKNTLIPLDMIFTNQSGVIVSIHKNAIPYDETAIFGGEAVFSVLELNAGVSKAKNIEIGDVLLHPAYNFYTSLPCDAK